MQSVQQCCTNNLRQHRTIPALRLKHRSGSCGTASALPKCSIMSGCGTRIVLRGQKPLALCDRCPCFGSLLPPLAALTFAASSIICAFGLASAAPRSPYRHLELCGIALKQYPLRMRKRFCVCRGYLFWKYFWNAVFCTVSERSRPFPTERYIMCNERITCSVGQDTLIPPRRNLVGLCCACKPSVKLHKTNDLLFPRLFPNTIPKRPQFAAQCQIIPVGIYDQICLVQAELAAFVQQALVHIHGNDFSQKQVVAA